MAQIFSTQIKVTFGDADPAGIMYFANMLDMAHQCFEEFIVAAGYSWQDWFRPKQWIVPIRHAECDFLAPFFPGQTYDVRVTVAQIRESSFQMSYEFHKSGKTHGIVKMVHAVLDMKMQKSAIPSGMRSRLEPFLGAP